MKVKVIDEEHEKDLENGINNFIKENDIDVIDIKLSSSCFFIVLFSFTALIMYTEKNN